MDIIDSSQVKTRLQDRKDELFRRYNIRALSLFGSVARNEARADSDIDFLVDFNNSADLFDLSGLAMELESIFSHRIDVVSGRILRSEIREQVLQDAVPI